MKYAKPFDPVTGLNAVLAEMAEQEEQWQEAARQWTQAAKLSNNPERCLERAKWCTEMAFQTA